MYFCKRNRGFEQIQLQRFGEYFTNAKFRELSVVEREDESEGENRIIDEVDGRCKA